MTPTGLTVKAITTWTRPLGRRGTGNGLSGRLTWISVDGTDAFVRENLRIPDTFLISSSARIGLGEKGISPSHGAISILELATDGDWDAIRSVVTKADTLRRPVLRGRFTVQWAKQQFQHQLTP